MHRVAVLTFLAAFTSTAYAQSDPSEVTDAEIARYKATAREECRAAGLARKDPQEHVDAFCACMIETLEKNVTRAQWQQAYFYRHTKQPADEQRVLKPHLPHVAACGKAKKEP